MAYKSFVNIHILGRCMAELPEKRDELQMTNDEKSGLSRENLRALRGEIALFAVDSWLYCQIASGMMLVRPSHAPYSASGLKRSVVNSK